MHFFSPVEEMMLTEVGPRRGPANKARPSLDRVRDPVKKTPIVVHDTRGFISRCVFRYIHELRAC